MIFDKQSFAKNAEPYIKKLIPASHIEVLDGMRVIFNESVFGRVDYKVNDQEFCIYPVPREWCVDAEQIKQMSLFGGD